MTETPYDEKQIEDFIKTTVGNGEFIAPVRFKRRKGDEYGYALQRITENYERSSRMLYPDGEVKIGKPTFVYEDGKELELDINYRLILDVLYDIANEQWRETGMVEASLEDITERLLLKKTCYLFDRLFEKMDGLLKERSDRYRRAYREYAGGEDMGRFTEYRTQLEDVCSGLILEQGKRSKALGIEYDPLDLDEPVYSDEDVERVVKTMEYFMQYWEREE